MQRTLFLHIGLPKTASTFLQQGVFRNLAHLRTAIMPKDRLFARPENDRLLSSVFKRSDTIWLRQGNEILDGLFGADWRSDQRDLLLSDEAIGRTASRHGLLGAHLNAMRDELREQGVTRMRIACFIRRQDQWLASHYAQISDRRPKAGQADFERMVTELADPWDERFTFGALLDHAATYRTLTAAVGAGEVTMMPMEWLIADRPALGRGLSEWLEREPGELQIASDETANVRKSGALSWHLRPGSRVQKIYWAARRRPSSIVLTPELSRSILKVYADSNGELVRSTGLDLDSMGYFFPSF